MRTSAPKIRSLIVTLAVYLVLPLALNGVIFRLGWDDARGENLNLPQGWIIGVIWMLLFTGMGVARWLVSRGSEPWADRWVDGLALLCLVYPLYTGGLKSETVGLAGALVTAGVAAVTTVRVWRSSHAASGLTSAVLAWVLYVETALARDLRH